MDSTAQMFLLSESSLFRMAEEPKSEKPSGSFIARLCQAKTQK